VAQLFPTAIISGRGREKVQGFVRLGELYYAGSHGMDIVGPQVGAALGSSCRGVLHLLPQLPRAPMLRCRGTASSRGAGCC
jgi:hypothetical protein